jgi:DNA-binding CsgD family transcriptional regulator
MLKGQDVKQIAESIREVASCDTRETLFAKVLSLCSPLFHADTGIVSLMKRGRMDRKTVVTKNISELSWRQYEDHFVRYDPILRSPFTPYPQDIYTTNDILPRKFLESSQYYKDFLLPLNLRWHMVVQLKHREETCALLCLIRSRGMPPFNDQDKERAELIAPCLTTSIEKVNALEKDHHKEIIIDAMVGGRQGGGTLIIDDCFSLVHANQEASNILRYLQSLEECEDEVPLSLSRLFLQYSQEFGKSESGVVKNHLIKTRKQRDVLVNIRSLKCGENRFYLLVFLQWKSHHEVEESAATTLTRREVEIAMMVPQGLRSQDIAEKLFISTSTVENHLQSIYMKLGICNRASLVRLIHENTMLGSRLFDESSGRVTN